MKIVAPAMLIAFFLTACERDTPHESVAGPAVEHAATVPASAAIQRTPAPAGARVFFVSPGDGDTVHSPLRLEFGAENVSIVPAGSDQPGSGHHHLIIDAPLPALDRPVPSDEHYIHFGNGASGAEITLTPGRHELQLLLADHRHVPHSPPVASEKIVINVSGDTEAASSPD